MNFANSTNLAVDVQYDDSSNTAVVAGVTFDDWASAVPLETYTHKVSGVAAYVPGEFYKRELPCILALIREHRLSPRCVVIDGFVHLDSKGRPGLGAHLFEALDHALPVIGVAKTSFAGIDDRFRVFRGNSTKPLYVTAAGVDLDVAQGLVRAMHGEFRLPTLLRRVDQICRGHDE